MEWRECEYIEGRYKNVVLDNRPYGLFDLDGTVIKTKSGCKFYKDVDDWEFFSADVKKIMKKFSKKFNIVLITNQAGIEKKKVDVIEWKTKVENICRELDIPILILCSRGDDIFRKPHPTFYNMIIKDRSKASMKNFFCGDAMGRKKDFSDTDLKFALNCNIKAVTPEQIFLKMPKQDKIIKYPILPKTSLQLSIEYKKCELLILVGCPASGKSFLANHIVNSSIYSYVIISRDNLGSIKKCIEKEEMLCKNRCSIIVDNTNPTIENRKEFIQIARKYNYKIRCIHVITDRHIAKHNNHHRRYVLGRDLIPNVAYNIYFKNLVEPKLEEGYEEILKIEPFSILDLNYNLYFF